MCIARVRAHLGRYLWGYDATDPDQPRSRFRHYLQIMAMVVRDLWDGMLSLRAMSLVYTTLLSIVPVLAVSLSVLKGFGLHDHLEPTLIDMLTPFGAANVELGSRIVGYVDNVKIGVLGSLGLGFLMFTVLSLIHKIELALNQTWRMPDSSHWIKRVGSYLSVLLVVPLLMSSAVVITTALNSPMVLSLIIRLPFFDHLMGISGKFTPYILIVAAFTFIYWVVPNTRVRLHSAFFGALVAGALWKVLAVLFGWFIDFSTSYTAIYSGFAIFLMLMIWIYLGWLIVLTGSSLAYYHQYPERLKWRKGDFHLSAAMREQLIVQLIVNIARYHDRRLTIDDLAKYQRVPVEIIRRMINALEVDDLVISSNDLPRYYLPAHPLEEIRMIDILRSARQAEANHQRINIYSDAVVSELLQSIERDYENRLGEQTLAELIHNKTELEF